MCRIVRSWVTECTLQIQTEDDLAALVGDQRLSTDHKVRVGVHQGND